MVAFPSTHRRAAGCRSGFGLGGKIVKAIRFGLAVFSRIPSSSQRAIRRLSYALSGKRPSFITSSQAELRPVLGAGQRRVNSLDMYETIWFRSRGDEV